MESIELYLFSCLVNTQKVFMGGMKERFSASEVKCLLLQLLKVILKRRKIRINATLFLRLSSPVNSYGFHSGSSLLA